MAATRDASADRAAGLGASPRGSGLSSASSSVVLQHGSSVSSVVSADSSTGLAAAQAPMSRSPSLQSLLVGGSSPVEGTSMSPRRSLTRDEATVFLRQVMRSMTPYRGDLFNTRGEYSDSVVYLARLGVEQGGSPPTAAGEAPRSRSSASPSSAVAPPSSPVPLVSVTSMESSSSSTTKAGLSLQIDSGRRGRGNPTAADVPLASPANATAASIRVAPTLAHASPASTTVVASPAQLRLGIDSTNPSPMAVSSTDNAPSPVRRQNHSSWWETMLTRPEEAHRPPELWEGLRGDADSEDGVGSPIPASPSATVDGAALADSPVNGSGPPRLVLLSRKDVSDRRREFGLESTATGAGTLTTSPGGVVHATGMRRTSLTGRTGPRSHHAASLPVSPVAVPLGTRMTSRATSPSAVGLTAAEPSSPSVGGSDGRRQRSWTVGSTGSSFGAGHSGHGGAGQRQARRSPDAPSEPRSPVVRPHGGEGHSRSPLASSAWQSLHPVSSSEDFVASAIISPALDEYQMFPLLASPTGRRELAEGRARLS